MNNLQGIISKSVSNANIQFETLGYISTNVANYNTVGFKSQRFENYLKEDGRLEGTIRTDFSNGVLFKTRRPLDVAIDGPGFIPVTKKDGTAVYTRDGAFSVNSEGYLVTSDNCLVGEGIKIPQGYDEIKISEDGAVSVTTKPDLEVKNLGKIPLVNFNNAEGLKTIDGNKLVATEESGKPFLIEGHQSLKQGNLERSNVSVFANVDSILRLNGSLIASTRIIKVVDDFYNKSINLRQ